MNRLKKLLGNLSTLIKTLILESELLFVAYSFISQVTRRRKQFDMDISFQGKKKKKMKGMGMCENGQLTDLEIEIRVEQQ